MRYLLDTDHISILQRKLGSEYLRLSDRMARCRSEDFALSVISFHEQCLGVNALIGRAKTDTQVVLAYELLDEVRQGFAFAQVLKFDEAAAGYFQQFRSQGVRIGTMDLRIASICLAHDLTLLTRNRRDFEQVQPLRLEGWTV